jgi:hypothetical protein
MSFIAPKDVTDKVPRNYRMSREIAEKIDDLSNEVGENQTFILECLLVYAIEAWEKKKNKKMFKRDN